MSFFVFFIFNCKFIFIKKKKKKISGTKKETQECNAVKGNLVSLVGITESDQINKDAKFLDEIKNVFDNMRHLLSLTQLETNSRTTLHEIH